MAQHMRNNSSGPKSIYLHLKDTDFMIMVYIFKAERTNGLREIEIETPSLNRGRRRT